MEDANATFVKRASSRNRKATKALLRANKSVKSKARHLGFTLTTKVLSLLEQNAIVDSDILKSPEDLDIVYKA
ncbi:hypothetical protein N7451_008724 [Penicillium sp. IBT 35674x]|nr:hypothetical protein N7451_008724 [Penicillium sp. IBT 35674x]